LDRVKEPEADQSTVSDLYQFCNVSKTSHNTTTLSNLMSRNEPTDHPDPLMINTRHWRPTIRRNRVHWNSISQKWL